MDMAAAMGLSTDTPLPADLPAQITQAVQQSEVHNEKQEALVHALLPSLQPGRQARLERAMQIARLTHWAEKAMHASKLAEQGAQDHV